LALPPLFHVHPGRDEEHRVATKIIGKLMEAVEAAVGVAQSLRQMEVSGRSYCWGKMERH
jgi:hypothetical protein